MDNLHCCVLLKHISTDRGGTFTDVVVIYPDGSEKVFKLLSRDPKNYQDAPIEALRRIVEKATGTTIPRGVPLDLSCIGWENVPSILTLADT